MAIFNFWRSIRAADWVSSAVSKLILVVSGVAAIEATSVCCAFADVINSNSVARSQCLFVFILIRFGVRIKLKLKYCFRVTVHRIRQILDELQLRQHTLTMTKKNPHLSMRIMYPNNVLLAATHIYHQIIQQSTK